MISLRFQLSESAWGNVLFLISCLACLLTPVVVGIQQYLQFGIGIEEMNDDPEALAGPPTCSVVNFTLRCVSSSCLYMLPFGSAVGLGGSALAWLSLLRMTRLILLPGYFRSWLNLNKAGTKGPEAALGKDGSLSQMEDAEIADGLANASMAMDNGTISRMLALLIFTCMYANAMACVWFRLGCIRLLPEGSSLGHCERDNPSWLDIDDVLDTSSSPSAYVRSLHFIAQTLFTVGFGDIHPVSHAEHVFALLSIVIASIFYAILISSLTSLLGNRGVTTKCFREELEAIKKYLTVRAVPLVVQERLSGYFEFLYGRSYGMHETRFLRHVPAQIRHSILEQCGEPLLRAVPFFRGQQHEQFVKRCLQLLQFRTYAPGSYLYQQHERPRELILLRAGRVEILLGKGDVEQPLPADGGSELNPGEEKLDDAKIADAGSSQLKASNSRQKRAVGGAPTRRKAALLTLVAGDYTGDYQLLFGTPAEASAFVVQYAETLVLTADAFEEALRSTGLGVGAGTSDRSNRWGWGVKLNANVVKRVASTPLTIAKPLPQAVDTPNHVQSIPTAARSSVQIAGRGRKRASVDALSSSKSSPSALQATSSLQAKVRQMHLEKVIVAYREVCIGGRPARWTDFHLDALRETLEAHKAMLVKLVRMQSTFNTTSVTADSQGGRKNKMSKMLDLIEGESGGEGDDRSATQRTVAWWNLYRRVKVVPPGHSFRLWWDVLVLVAVLYYTLVLPLRVMVVSWCEVPGERAPSIPQQLYYCLSSWHSTMIADYFCDAVLVFNFYFSARLFAFRQFNGEVDQVVNDSDSIWEAFRVQWKCAVLLALLLPYDALALVTGYVQLFRLTRLAYVTQVPQIISNIQLYLERERNYTVSSESVTVIHLVVATFTLVVWFSVGWCMISRRSAEAIGASVPETSWISSFYYCLTCITTVGYGDIYPKALSETVYVIMLSTVGPAFTATIIANVASYVHSVDTSKDNVEHRRLVVAHWLRHLGHTGIQPKSTASDNSASGVAVKAATGRRRAVPISRKKSNAAGGIAAVAASTSLSSAASLGIGTGADLGAYNLEGADSGDSSVGEELMVQSAAYGNLGGGGLQEAASDLFSYLSKERHGLHEDEILENLVPEPIQREIRLTSYETLVPNILVFERFAPEVIRDLLLEMDVRIYSKKSIVLDFPVCASASAAGFHGSVASVPADGMFLIRSGMVSLTEQQTATNSASLEAYRNITVSQRNTGESFAESALVEEWLRNPYQVKAVVDCELLFLSRDAFQRVMRRHPSARQHMPFVKLAAKSAGALVKNFVKLQQEQRHALEHLQETRERRAYFLHPRGVPALMWSACLLTVAIYNVMLLPVRIAFLEGWRGSAADTALKGVDYFIDVIYLVDIFLRSYCLGYYDQNDLIMMRQKIAVNYQEKNRPWNQFYLHLLASLPADLVVQCAQLGSDSSSFSTEPTSGVFDSGQVLALLRLNRLLRLYDTSSLWKDLEDRIGRVLLSVPSPFDMIRMLLARCFRSIRQALHTQARVYAGMTALTPLAASEGDSAETISNNQSSNMFFGLTKLLLAIGVGAHICACIFFIIANHIHHFGSAHNWADSAGILRGCSLGARLKDDSGVQVVGCMAPASLEVVWDQYVHALYWAMTVMYSVGYGDIVPVADGEKVFNILFFAAGTFALAMVIVYVNNIFCQLDVTSDLYESRLDRIKSVVSRERISAPLRAKIGLYMGKLWTAQRGATNSEICQFLAPVQRLYTSALHSHPVLQVQLGRMFFVASSSLHFRRDFVSQLKLRHYIRGDKLFQTGEAANTLYVILSGELCMQRTFKRRGNNQKIDGLSPFGDASHLKNRLPFKTKPMERAMERNAGGLSSAPQFNAGDLDQKEPRQTLAAMVEGCPGDFEFFTRACYSCEAVVTSGVGENAGSMGAGAGSGGSSGGGGGRGAAVAGASGESACEDCSILEISWSAFWKLVIDHGQGAQYFSALGISSNRAGSGGAKKSSSVVFSLLSRSSTACAVKNFEGNLKTEKMAKMVQMMSSSAPMVRWDNVIMPDANIARAFQIVNLAVIIYATITVPYFMAFAIDFSRTTSNAYESLPMMMPASTIRALAVGDLLINVFCMVDICLSLTRFAREDGQVLVTQPTKFAAVYARSLLLWDCIAASPVAALVLLANETQSYSYCRILLLLRVLKLSASLKSAMSTFEMHVLGGDQLNPNFIRVLQFVACIWIFIHGVAGAFVWLGHYEISVFLRNLPTAPALGSLEDASWITANSYDHAQLLPSELYLRGYYWSAYTVITVGYGSIRLVTNAERLLAVFSMSIGAVACNAGIAAVLGGIISTADRLSGTCRRHVESAMRFCESNKIHELIQHQLQTHDLYRCRELDHSISEEEELDILGTAIRFEFIHSCVSASLGAIRFISPVSFPHIQKRGNSREDVDVHNAGFVHSLVRLMRPYTAIPTQEVIPATNVLAAQKNAADCLEGWACDLFVLRRGLCHYEVQGSGDGKDVRLLISPGDVLIPYTNSAFLDLVHCDGCCSTPKAAVGVSNEAADKNDEVSESAPGLSSDIVEDIECEDRVKLICVTVLSITTPVSAPICFVIEAICRGVRAVTAEQRGTCVYTSSAANVHRREDSPQPTAVCASNVSDEALSVVTMVDETLLMNVPVDADDLRFVVWGNKKGPDDNGNGRECLFTGSVNLEALTNSAAADFGKSLSGQSARGHRATALGGETAAAVEAIVVMPSSNKAEPGPSDGETNISNNTRKRSKRNQSGAVIQGDKRKSARGLQAKHPAQRSGVVSIATLLQQKTSEDRQPGDESSRDDEDNESDEASAATVDSASSGDESGSGSGNGSGSGSTCLQSTASTAGMSEEEAEESGEERERAEALVSEAGGDGISTATEQQRAITLQLDGADGLTACLLTILVTQLSKQPLGKSPSAAGADGKLHKSHHSDNKVHKFGDSLGLDGESKLRAQGDSLVEAEAAGKSGKERKHDKGLAGKKGRNKEKGKGKNKEKNESDIRVTDGVENGSELAVCCLGDACRRKRFTYRVVADEYCHFFRVPGHEILSQLAYYERSLLPLEVRLKDMYAEACGAADGFPNVSTSGSMPQHGLQSPPSLSLKTLNLAALVEEKPELAGQVAGIGAAHAALRSGGHVPPNTNGNASGNSSGNSPGSGPGGIGGGILISPRSPRIPRANALERGPINPEISPAQRDNFNIESPSTAPATRGAAASMHAIRIRHPTVHLQDLENL